MTYEARFQSQVTFSSIHQRLVEFIFPAKLKSNEKCGVIVAGSTGVERASAGMSLVSRVEGFQVNITTPNVKEIIPTELLVQQLNVPTQDLSRSPFDVA